MTANGFINFFTCLWRHCLSLKRFNLSLFIRLCAVVHLNYKPLLKVVQWRRTLNSKLSKYISSNSSSLGLATWHLLRWPRDKSTPAHQQSTPSRSSAKTSSLPPSTSSTRMTPPTCPQRSRSHKWCCSKQIWILLSLARNSRNLAYQVSWLSCPIPTTTRCMPCQLNRLKTN